jgi:hypothetical protein
MTPALQELLGRVEGATASEQWVLVRDAARLLTPGGDPKRAVINQLCDAGAFTDAAMALCERVLPLARVMVERFGAGAGWAMVEPVGSITKHMTDGNTPALALLAALIKAKLSDTTP